MDGSKRKLNLLKQFFRIKCFDAITASHRVSFIWGPVHLGESSAGARPSGAWTEASVDDSRRATCIQHKESPAAVGELLTRADGGYRYTVALRTGEL